jgi:hypothetical protein
MRAVFGAAGVPSGVGRSRLRNRTRSRWHKARNRIAESTQWSSSGDMTLDGA